MARFLNNRKMATGKVPGELIHLGKKQIDAVQIRLIDFTAENLTEKKLKTLDSCQPYLKLDTVSWVNIDGLHDPKVIQKLGDLFDIHGLLLEDMLNTGQRPKVAETDKLIILILKWMDYNETDRKLHAEQISFILDENYLITLQEKVGNHFDHIRERIRKNGGRVRRKGADYLTYLLLDAIVDNYLINIEKLGDTIERIESHIFIPKQTGLMQEIYKHKNEINFLRKNIRPMKEIVLHLIENESGFIMEDNLKYFRDLSDLVVQASETVEIYQVMLNDQMMIYHASIDSRANEIMKVLTMFSAFFIPLTFVTGVYGMNFDYLPELHLKFGYIYFWALMILIVSSLLIYFRRKRWF